MAVTIDATVGGTAANSYLTLVDAEAYFETRLHKSTWTSAVDEDKRIALVWSTRLIDYFFRFSGIRQTNIQSLDWPRYEAYYLEDPSRLAGYDYSILEYIIPIEVRNAVAEYAMTLLEGDPTAPRSDSGIKSMEVDVISIVFDKNDKIEKVPETVIDLLDSIGIFTAETSSSKNTKQVNLYRT